jgi:hypothetical protein
MVGRRLEGDVQRDFQLVPRRGRHQVLEVLDRAKARLDRRVSAFVRTDRPRAPRIPGVRRH